jgi:hypothetical protein
MERLGGLLGERGRLLRAVLPGVGADIPGDPERLLRSGLELANATWRLQSVGFAWTRYLVLTFRWVAISEERRDGLVDLGLNLATGAALDDMTEALVAAARQAPDSLGPAPELLPALWPAERLTTAVERALLLRIRTSLEPFLATMTRRQGRDLERLRGYYGDLQREARARRAALSGEDLTARQQAAREREEARLAAVAREYQAKVADLREKYALSLSADWLQALEVLAPVQRLTVQVRRRKAERILHLDWSPLVRRLEPPPCEYGFTTDRIRMVCDDALHLVTPAAHRDCPGCGRPYCRACHPQRCPRCGWGEGGQGKDK